MPSSEPSSEPSLSPSETSFNVLQGVSASKTSCCSFENCEARVTDGNLNNQAIGDNCGTEQELVFDLGSSGRTFSTFSYVFCNPPGFTNGAVKEFILSASNSIDGPWTEALSGNLPEGTAAMKGVAIDFGLTGVTSGRFWKWAAMSNHGNGSYIWTCEIELRRKRPSETSFNVLQGVSASKTSCCSFENCEARVTDGNLNNQAIGDNCGTEQELVFDLGSSGRTFSTFSYVFCNPPGFTNGAVKEFILSASNSIDGPWTEALSGNLPEGTAAMKGVAIDFGLTGVTSGRFWKWAAMSNHGNGSYIWTCEIELRT